MRLNQRSIYVGLFALQIVLGVYLLFSYLEGKSGIKIEKSDAPQSLQITDPNEVGRLGTLGIGAVRKAKFVNFNDDGNSVSKSCCTRWMTNGKFPNHS